MYLYEVMTTGDESIELETAYDYGIGLISNRKPNASHAWFLHNSHIFLKYIVVTIYPYKLLAGRKRQINIKIYIV